MKKKGFTLIELLAVIVILAVIAVIAIPNVVNTVNKSKQKTAEEAGLAISKAARNYYQAALLDYETLNEIDLAGKDLEYEGKKPTKGIAYFDETGKMYAKMYYDSFCVMVDAEGSVVSEKIKIEDCKVNGVVVSLVTGDDNIKYETKEYEKGDKIGVLPTPEREGYIFLGWYTKVDNKEEKVTEDTIVEDTVVKTIYARWEAIKYTVTLDPKGNTLKAINGWTVSNGYAKKVLAYDSLYGVLPTIEKKGYQFKGWYLNDTLVESTSFVKTASDHTLVAVLSPAKYTVTLKTEIGEIPSTTGWNITSVNTTNDTATKVIEYGSTYGVLPKIEKEGYTFLGWYLNDKKIEEDTAVETLSNQVLVAKFSGVEYTVTLDAKGGTLATNKVKVTYGSTYGNIPTPEKEGYQFIGWYLTNGTKVESNTKVEISSNHTLNAVYNVKDYIVTFVYNNGSANTTKTVSYNSTYGVLPTPTKVGMTFKGWYTIGNEKIESTTKVTITDNIVLYAKYEGNKYTVTLNPNGGIVSVTTKEVTYNSTYGVLPTPTKDGYIFNGWYTLGGVLVNENTKVEITSNQTLYAQYSKNEYTLSFNPNGGAVSPVSKMVTYNSAYGTLPTPTRTGYTFNGWYTSTTGGVKVDSTTVLTENANKVIYARWTANTYTVTFVYNNGSANTTKEVTYNSAYGVLPSVTKTGYTFNGWYTSQAGGTRVINTDTVKITSNQTLYAQYTQNTYTVTLKTDKGSISSSSWTVSSTTTTNDTATKKIAYDSTYSDLPVLTKAGYTFNGWYYNNTKIDNTTKLVVASNHTLNAKWTANTYTVTFNTNGGSAVSSKTVTYDSTYGNIPTPEKEGYQFIGWYLTNGTKVESTTKVLTASNHTLYAQWKDVTPPTLSVTKSNPNWGTYILTVNTTDDSGIKQIRYYFNGKLVYAGTNTSYTGTAEYIDNAYRIESEDNAGNVAVETGSFYVVQCFVAGTKVLTSNGLTNIEDIKVGDYVYALNLDKNEKELSKVTNTLETVNDIIYRITLENGKVINSTEKHKYYVLDKGWVKAYKLKSGDTLSSTVVGPVKIKSVEKILYDEPVKVYSLTVDGIHNYLITEYEVLVHNVASPRPPEENKNIIFSTSMKNVWTITDLQTSTNYSWDASANNTFTIVKSYSGGYAFKFYNNTTGCTGYGTAIISGNDAKLNVSCSNNEISTVYDTKAPTLTVSTKTPSWSNYTITVTTSDNSGIKQIRYYINGTLVYSGLNKTYSSTTSSSSVTYKVESEDNYGNVSTKTGTIYVTQCFVAGTKVLTKNGLKNIEDIKIGDYVYAINLDTNEKELSLVTNTITTYNNKIYEVTLENNEVIKSTEKHEYYVLDKGWVRAYELKVGDTLSSTIKGKLKIKNIKVVEYDKPIRTYNLTVDGIHNYLITEYEVLVHNASSKTTS